MFLGLFFAILNLYSQDFEHVFKSYTVDEGMPSSLTFKIIQDKEGYIWFGSNRGLVKYNGYEFKRYTVKDGLSVNVVYHVCADDDNTIYFIGSDNKIHYVKDNVVYEFDGNSEIKDIAPRAQILSLVADENNIYLSYWNDSNHSTYFKFSKEGVLLEKNTLEYGAELKSIGDDIVIQCAGFVKLEENDQFSISYNGVDTVFNLDFKLLNVAYTAKATDKIYFSVQTYLFSFENGKFEILKNFENTIFNLAVDHNNHLYIAFYNDGLIKYENGNLNKPTQLLSNQASISILFDSNNNLWCGSSHNGLQFSTLGDFAHLKFKERVSDIDFLGDENQLLAIIEKENIYSVSGKGILEKTQNKQNVIKHLSNENKYRYYAYKDKILNFKNQRFDTYTTPRGDFYVDYKTINDSLLYIMGRNQFILEHKDYEKVKCYSVQGRLQCFEYVNDDIFLLGTSDGLKTADLNKHSEPYGIYGIDYIRYDLQIEPYYIKHRFFNSSIADIVVKDSVRIFASIELGLWIEIDSTSRWLTEEEGLISDNIEKIIYQDGYIIVSSNSGISVIDNDFNIRNFNTSNGLITNEVDDLYYRNDSIWLASKLGISLLNIKDKSVSQQENIPLILKKVKVNDRERKLGSSLSLRHLHGRIEVEYEALNYVADGEINYKYKLEGLEDNWNFTDNRSVRYTNLPAGKFKLLMSYELEGKKWTEPVVLLSFKKRIPIMTHWAFIIVYILLSIWLFIKFSNIRNRRQMKIQQNELTILELERKALQAQMNPHFMFNSLSSLQYMIMKDRKQDSEAYLTKFSKFTRLTLNHSTEKYIPIEDEIELLKNYIELEQTRFEKRFEYSITNKVSDPKVKIPPMLIQPFIENAIIHGFEGLKRQGELSILFENNSSNTILCSIIDNGVGRDASQKNTRHKKSFGMSLVLNRLKLLHEEGDISITDVIDEDQVAGTKVVVKIPFVS